jgi:hypothetical protein
MSNKKTHSTTRNTEQSKALKKNQNNYRNSEYQNKNISVKNDVKNYYLIPIFIVLCIIPFIVRMKPYNPNLSQFQWFSNTDQVLDFFLYYKHWILVIVASIMLMIIALKAYNKHSGIKYLSIFMPLMIYAVLTLLSTIFSKYSSFSFKGGFEQFESMFALLSYCLITYYAFLFVQSEKDLKLIIRFILGLALAMSLLGVMQFLGHDLFASKLGYKLIIPQKYQSNLNLTFNFAKNMVYMTLYNPNYVGVFVSLLAPILAVLLIFQKKLINIILTIIALIGLIICTIGAQSLTSIIGLAGAVLFIIIFMWRYLLKRYYITIPTIIVLVIGLLILNSRTDQFLLNKLNSALRISKTEYALTDMRTNDDNISLTYKGNKMYLSVNVDQNQMFSFVPLDEKEELISTTYDSTTNTILMEDARFQGISLGTLADNPGFFYIQVDGQQYIFTNQIVKGTYYYLNPVNKLDKMITAPTALFTGYEELASMRGYIWSRTIPILKKYVILGSGPDTFAIAFPQQDYLGLQRAGFGTALLTKPHNLYLQIAVQTGILSLIAFLTFYGMYLVTSIRLYLRSRYENIYAQLGVGIFIGSLSYMISGLTYDSNITTAPIFWTLMGIGISINHRYKTMCKDYNTSLKE